MPDNIYYQLELDKVIERLDGSRPRLLLHSCCGPCSSYVLEYLSELFDITVLYYNPNIAPDTEYELRLGEQSRLVDMLNTGGAGIKHVADSYGHDEFLNAVNGLEGEPEGGARCVICIGMRIERAALLAADGGFDWFCTTLSVSPYKDAPGINRLGAEMERRYGVKFLPSDFKKREGYQRSIELSKKYGLYRQDYCGCEFSRDGKKENPADGGGES